MNVSLCLASTAPAHGNTTGTRFFINTGTRLQYRYWQLFLCTGTIGMQQLTLGFISAVILTPIGSLNMKYFPLISTTVQSLLKSQMKFI